LLLLLLVVLCRLCSIWHCLQCNARLLLRGLVPELLHHHVLCGRGSVPAIL
jgi:hypothetical protein